MGVSEEERLDWKCECGHMMRAHHALHGGGRGNCSHCMCHMFRSIPKEYEVVDHPEHYGGKDDPYEHIKVCEALGWGYHVGNATKYLWRMGKKPGASELQDLKKAIWLLNRLKDKLEGKTDVAEENARNSDPSPGK